MAYRNNQPYNELPLLPPPDGIETAAVLRRCITAREALAELRWAGKLVPNQAILINAIPLQEARLSSEIENIVTTQDALYRAAVDAEGQSDPAAREVLRYRTALRRGYEALLAGQRISIDLMLDLCATIRASDANLRDQEPILIEDVAARAAIYTPPRGRARIVGLLQNLVAFLNEASALDPLVRLAAAHYQFEAIHPFVDGNGRTGRILNVLYLIQERLLEIPVLYLSRYIIQTKQAYYRRLRAVTEQGDWQGWLLYMLEGIEQTARWTTGRIEAIRALIDATAERVRAELPGIYSPELVELVFVQPYCKIGFVVEAGIAQRNAASRYLRELERIGVLQGERVGREMVYRNPALLELLST